MDLPAAPGILAPPAPPVTALPKGAQEEKLRAAAKQFEGVFVQMMLAEMRKSVPKNDYFGSSRGEEVFEELLDQRYAEAVTNRSNLGIADAITRKLKRTLHAEALKGAEGSLPTEPAGDAAPVPAPVPASAPADGNPDREVLA